MNVKKSVWTKAIKTTSGFEGSGYGNVTGNFDGAYLSLGIIQWNLGAGTLQPMLYDFIINYANVAEKALGNVYFLQLQNVVIKNTYKQWAVDIQNNNKIIEPWLTKLKTMLLTPEFITIQDRYMRPYKETAIALCIKHKLTTDRAFCLFFDIAVQNGSLTNVVLQSQTYSEKLKEVARIAASMKPKWYNDVLTRKMAIATGYGVVHGDTYNFDFTDNSAFYDDELLRAVEGLVNKRIINSPDYWLENAEVNMTINGEWMGILLMKTTEKNNLQDAVNALVQTGAIQNPDYWLNNAVKDKTIIGLYASILIKRLGGIKI